MFICILYFTSCILSVSLDSTDHGMIAVFAIFGTLIAIGTIADGILNIMKLDIVPEKFLQVEDILENLFIFCSLRFSKASRLTVIL